MIKKKKINANIFFPTFSQLELHVYEQVINLFRTTRRYILRGTYVSVGVEGEVDFDGALASQDEVPQGDGLRLGECLGPGVSFAARVGRGSNG